MKSRSAEDAQELDLVDHLRELRDVLMKSLIGLALASVLAFTIMDLLIAWLRIPIDKAALHLPKEAVELVMIRPAEFLITKLKAAVFFAFVISFPHTLYRIWSFIAPGLYAKEQKRVLLFVATGSFAFLLGVALAYQYGFEMFFRFLLSDAYASNITVTLSIDEVFHFIIRLLLVFGLIFETPIVMFILIRAELVEVATVKKMRGVLFIAGLVLGAVLTPPDIVSQIVVAVILIVFMEIGLWAAQLFPKKESLDEPTG
jgi:sec-independent protein translocase protein TatC